MGATIESWFMRVTERRPRLDFFLALATLSLTTLALAAVVAHFENQARWSYIVSDSGSQWLHQPGHRLQGLWLATYPQHVNYVPYGLTIAAAAISIALAFIVGWTVVVACYDAQALMSPTIIRRALWVALGGDCILVLVDFFFNIAQRAHSAEFMFSLLPPFRSSLDPNNTLESAFVYPGTFDLASWACQVSRPNYLEKFGYKPVLSQLCTQSNVVLWTSLALALSTIAMSTLVWYDSRGPRLLIRKSDEVVREQRLSSV